MSDVLVSAIITTYNYGRYVVEAVESVLAQTYPHVEVIVVDDGSTDDTPQRLAPFMDRIRYIRQENAGVDAARNNGIRAARGKFIGLLDADDLWHPRRIERQMKFIDEQPDVAVVAGAPITDVSNGWPKLPEETPSVLVSLESLVVQARFAPSGVLIRRDCFDTIGFFRPNICGAEDRDVWVRLAAHYPIHLLKLPLMFYRNHGQNLSTTASRMDAVDRRMLRGVFRDVPALHGRWILRLKAFSYAASMSSFLYTASGNHVAALARIVESIVLWPFAYEPGHPKTPAQRWKMLGVITLRILHLKPPHGTLALADGKSYG